MLCVPRKVQADLISAFSIFKLVNSFSNTVTLRPQVACTHASLYLDAPVNYWKLSEDDYKKHSSKSLRSCQVLLNSPV